MKRHAPQKSNDGRMPLADHLRELRNRLFVSVLALAVTTVVGWVIHDWLIHQMTHQLCTIKVTGIGRPTKDCPNGILYNDGPLAGLSLSFKVSMLAGFVLAAPVWSYQLWAFVAPGLYKKEKKYGLGFVGAAVPLFVGGAVLAFEIFPKAMRILLGFNPGGFATAVQGSAFLDFFMRMVLVFGLSFEIPLLLVLLNFLGIVSAKRLRGWWRIVVFAIFVFAAVATPTGDPLTMTVLAVPICVLFFIALIVATMRDRYVERRRAKEDPDHFLDPDQPSVLDLDGSGTGADPLDLPEPVNASDLAAGEPMVYHPDDVT